MGIKMLIGSRKKNILFGLQCIILISTMMLSRCQTFQRSSVFQQQQPTIQLFVTTRTTSTVVSALNIRTMSSTFHNKYSSSSLRLLFHGPLSVSNTANNNKFYSYNPNQRTSKNDCSISSFREIHINANNNFLLLRNFNGRQYDATTQCPGSVLSPKHHRRRLMWLGATVGGGNDSDDETNTSYNKTIDSTWNVPELKKEVLRLIQRAHKKIGQSSQRYEQAQKVVEELNTNPNTTLEQLENCPDIILFQNQLMKWQTRVKDLNQLENELRSIKNNSNLLLPPTTAQKVVDLQVNDIPPTRVERSPKKPKGPRLETKRVPYRQYHTENGTELRVGKRAEDNDELTMNPIHRDSNNWWLHASGCPGSHVVIRCQHEQFDQIPREVVIDAASLAARYSKCFNNSYSGTIHVSITKCRDIKKPFGAKPGLVQLTGKVHLVSVHMKDAQKRLERLEK